MVAASIPSCRSNSGEPDPHKVLRDGSLGICQEMRRNELESSATQSGRWVEERVTKASSVSSRASDRVSTRKAWGEGELEEEKEQGLRDELEKGATREVFGAGAEILADVCLPAMTAKSADDWDPALDSVLPAGKLNGWAKTQEDEDWLEDVDKTPSSEIGSHKTCSTQWSEMESQFSGMESQLSGNSFAGEEGSVMSGECYYLLVRGWFVSFESCFLSDSFFFATRCTLYCHRF